MTCEEVKALAAELALGLVTGDERAEAVAHAGTCSSCQAEVDQLATVADRLLLLAPEAAPPPGLVDRVTAAFDAAIPVPRAQPRRIRWLAAAAVLVAVASIAGAAGWAASRPDRRTREYVGALRTLGGSSLRAAALRTPDGTPAGELFAYEGTTSWIFLSIEAGNVPDGAYRVLLQPPGAMAVSLGALTVVAGRGSLGATTDLDVTRLRSVSVVDGAGRPVAGAALEE